MAYVKINNIMGFEISMLPGERTHNSTGDLAFHPKVKEMYLEKGYDNSPKTREEADSKRMLHYNGLATSFPNIVSYPYCGQDGMAVFAQLIGTRYLYGQAMRDAVSEARESGKPFSEEEIRSMNPQIANVSLLAPVRFEGRNYLLSQIKGETLDSGELLIPLIAGGIEGERVHEFWPFVKDNHKQLLRALRREGHEELDLRVEDLDPHQFIWMINEPDWGYVNFVSIAGSVDLYAILHSYEDSSKRQLGLEKELEVAALALIPTEGFRMEETQGKTTLKGITCYRPGINGLHPATEDVKLIPISKAILEHISNKENLRYLL